METMEQATVKCSGCGASAPAGDLCPACGRLQPFPAGADHFAVLAVPRQLALERAELERRFHQLNRRFHPDYFRLRSPEEQAISLENSAAVNTAYRALRDPVSRVEYLLQQEGMALGSAGQAKPPAELFEEILELQEVRQEFEAGGRTDPGLADRLRAAQADFEARRAGTEPELRALFPAWDAGASGERRTLLTRMRDILATRAYLGTLLRDLATALDGAGDGRVA
jgi:molecular chaperone HscB